MAARHDAGRPVLLGEVGQGDHHVAEDVPVGPGQAVQDVVSMDGLGRLAGPDRRRAVGAEQAVLAEHAPDHGEDVLVHGELLEDRVGVQQIEVPDGAVAVEGLHEGAAPRAVHGGHGGEGRVAQLGGQGVAPEAVAVAPQLGQVVLDGGVGARRTGGFGGLAGVVPEVGVGHRAIIAPQS